MISKEQRDKIFIEYCDADATHNTGTLAEVMDAHFVELLDALDAADLEIAKLREQLARAVDAIYGILKCNGEPCEFCDTCSDCRTPDSCPNNHFKNFRLRAAAEAALADKEGT
jgi:hypothetical protein